MPYKQQSGFKQQFGFTLTELLIALMILGEIATFTIPKILNSQQNAKNNAAAKEAIAMVTGAYQQYMMRNGTSSSTTMGDFTQYMNYVGVDTSSILDDHVGYNGAFDCSARLCLKMHGGGVLFPYADTMSFGGTATTNALLIYFDPDGLRANSSSDVPGKSVAFFLYYNAGLTTRANMRSGTCSNSGCHSASPSADPSWFGW